MVNLSKFNTCQIVDGAGGVSINTANENGVVVSRQVNDGEISGETVAVTVADDYLVLYDGKVLKRIANGLFIEKGV